ncbi:ABC transporter substrate-binding protein [Conexibacter sp. CPCC 206217]|nr:ABC transporter substrate-binding protein [Conexibacter sp. CPCC 206217]
MNSRRGVAALVALACAAALAVAGCGSSSSSDGGTTASADLSRAARKPDSATPVRLGVTGLGINLYWDLIAADRAGIFRDNNLTPTFVAVSTPGDLVSAASGGSTDFVSVATDTLINAEDRGAPLKIVASEAYGSYDLVAKNSIGDWEQLKGKKVGIADPGSGSTVLLNALLAKHGLTPKDVTYVPAAATPQRLAALQSGAVDAALLADPANYTAIETGDFHSLGNTVDAVYPYQITTHAVNEDFAKKNPSAVIAFVTSIQQAHDWLYDPANKDAAIDAFADVARVPRAIAERSYDAMFNRFRTMSPSAQIDPRAMAAVYDAMNTTTGQRTERSDDRYIDPAYLRAAGVN